MIFQILVGVYFLCIQNVAGSNSQCRENNYYNSTLCVPCPPYCATCESDTNCTQCATGFYGDLCKTACLQNCSVSECHLQYGHCTYGCPDGEFLNEDRRRCVSCPENCRVCSSMSNCFTCQDGFYGQNCSSMCPSECADRACDQYGTCLQCKEGYYRQADICLPCLKSCITCDNSTHCSSSNETHARSFHAKCIRRCSENTTNFVSNFDQRCGISLDNIMQDQSSCFAVNLNQNYKCTTWRCCISCHTEDCKVTHIEIHKCLSYERCSTECNPAKKHHLIKDVDGIAIQTLCEQTCSIHHATDGKREHMCSSITEGPITRREDIDCFQEPVSTVHSSEDQSTLITVVVVAACIVVILLVGEVACQHRKRFGRSIRRLGSPDVALAEEPVQRPCGMTSQVQVTTTPNRSPTVESLYDIANCSQCVTYNGVYNVTILPHRGKIPDDTYDKASSCKFVAHTRPYNNASFPLQCRGKSADVYDKASCSIFFAHTRAYNNSNVSLERHGTTLDMYDNASCSTVVADNSVCNNTSIPLQRCGTQFDRYDTATCYNVVTKGGINNTLACTPHKSYVDNDDDDDDDDGDDDEYDHVYFDQSAPVDDTYSEVRNFRPK